MAPVTTYDPDRLAALGAEYARCRRRLDTIRPEIAEQIRAGAAAGASWSELVRLSRYGPETVVRIRDGLDRTGKRPRAGVDEGASGV